jgi:hypothetical protein
LNARCKEVILIGLASYSSYSDDLAASKHLPAVYNDMKRMYDFFEKLNFKTYCYLSGESGAVTDFKNTINLDETSQNKPQKNRVRFLANITKTNLIGEDYKDRLNWKNKIIQLKKTN